MIVQTYLKDKKQKLQFQYDYIAKQLESTYELIQEKVIERLNREATELELVRSNLNKLVQKSTRATIPSRDSQISHLISPKSSIANTDNSYKENIDWTRGRFSGTTLKIVVRNGQIIEKIFLTPKGTRLSVKRSELGLLARMSLKSS